MQKCNTQILIVVVLVIAIVASQTTAAPQSPFDKIPPEVMPGSTLRAQRARPNPSMDHHRSNGATSQDHAATHGTGFGMY
jgi:hypothetical protein